MRPSAWLLPVVSLLGSSCLPDAREAAVRVDVTYTFKAGCITVLARDGTDAGREDREQLEVLQGGPSTVRLAVFRQEGWGHTLEITTLAHEQTCAGPVVAQEVNTVQLQKAGIQELSVTLVAEDVDGDGYMSPASDGTDCKDGIAAINPGASEVCDDQDNNCDGNADEAGGQGWYPDRDGDGFGDRTATALTSCARPAGPPVYVSNGTDCLDSNDTVFPRVDAIEPRCDDLDDDCDGTADDDFNLKGAACFSPCAGQYVCNASGTGVSCNAPAQLSLYPDGDGDGAGAELVASVGMICPGTALPLNTAVNQEDCDDQDPHNRRGRGEVCDARDNTCNSTRDEGDVCGGRGWRVLNDGALTGARQWKTVALGPNGLPVWIAGTGGKLAVRKVAGQPFESLDEQCGTHDWLSAWVRPDGVVFLAGAGGRLAQHDGTSCSNAATSESAQPINGLIGFPQEASSPLFAAHDFGRLAAWTPGSNAADRYNLFPERYFGAHALASSLLLAVGGTEEDPSVPSITSYPGTGGEAAVIRHTLTGVPGGYNGSLRGVWMGGPRLAYALGDDGLVMKWNGETGWSKVDPPPDDTAADFTSVVVLDPSSIYTSDTDGVIRRLTATGWAAHPTFDADRPLREIALSSPGDIWAVGDDGRVLHFPE
jgi:hypothetical protein